MFLYSRYLRRQQAHQLELLLLLLENGPSIERPLIPDARIDIETISNANALADFRFTIDQLKYVTTMIGVPTCVKTSSRDRIMGLEAMAMLLRRLVYPNRLSELRKDFGRSEPACCRIVNHVG